MVEFKDRIRFLRDSKNLSIKLFASELGVSLTTVVNWESGISTPNSTLLLKIARFFNVSTDYLLDNENEKVIKVDFLSDATIYKLNDFLDSVKKSIEK